MTTIEARPVHACSAKVKRKLHFRVPRERMTSPPPLATSVLRPCAARGPKSHFLVMRIIVWSEVTEKYAGAFLTSATNIHTGDQQREAHSWQVTTFIPLRAHVGALGYVA